MLMEHLSTITMKKMTKRHEMTKNNDTFKDPAIIPVGSTVAIQCDNDAPWTHSTVIAHSDVSHNNHLDKVHLVNTG